jgi:uncharacterized protein YoxC
VKRLRVKKAEMEAKLAAANSEEERLQILQEYQSQFQEGSKEYLDLQRRIEIQQDKVSAATNKNTKEIAKASAAEFDHALAMSDKNEQVDLLRARLEQLDPASAEYAKRSEQLKKAEEAQAKATDQLTDAQFEAQLATQDRAGKIDMLHQKLNGLTVGSLEYEKTLKRVNALEQQAGASGGAGKKKKPKLGKGDVESSPFQGLADIGKTVNEVGDNFKKVTDAVNNAKTAFAKFQEKIAPLFKFLNEHAGAVTFIMQRLVTSFAIGLAIEKVVKPLLGLVAGIRQFITWGNVFWVLLAFLGYAWKTNLGGLRDIVADVWAKIQAPLKNIMEIFGRLKAAFDSGGLSGAFQALLDELPGLGQAVGNIGTTIFEGAKKWVQPAIDAIGKVVDGVLVWFREGGALRLLDGIKEKIESLLSGDGGGFLSSAAIVSGVLGLVGGLSLVIQGAFGGLIQWLNQNGPGLLNKVGNFLQEKIPVVFEYLLNGLVIALAALNEGFIPVLFMILKRVVDIGAWLIPMIPDLISGIVSALSLMIAWVFSRGIPLMVSGLFDFFTYTFNKIGEMLPELGLNLGRLLGSTITKVVGALIVGIGGLLVQLWVSLQNGSFMAGAKALLMSILNLLWGLIKGIGGVVLGIFLGLLEPLASIGSQLLAGLGQGVLGGIGILIQAFVQVFNECLTWVKNFLGIQSPSTVFADIGNWIVMGLIQGLQAMLGVIDLFMGWFTTIKGVIVNTTLDWFNFYVAKINEWISWGQGVFNTFSLYMTTLWTVLKAAVVLIITEWLGWIVTSVTTFIADRITQFNTFSTGVQKVWTDLKAAVISTVSQWFADLLEKANKIRDDVTSAFSQLNTKVTGIVNGVVSSVKGAWTDLALNASNAWSGIVNNAISSFNSITSRVNSVINGPNGVKSILDGAWTGIKETAKTAWDNLVDGIVNAFDGVGTKLKDKLNDIIDKANDAIDSLNAVADAVGLGHIGHIPKIYYALGTNYAQGGLAMVGENGPELVNLPRGSEVKTSGQTLDMFSKIANDMSKRVADVVSKATSAMEQATVNVTDAFVSAMRNGNGHVEMATQTIINDKSTHTTERHDHWNLTVNTRATTPSVIRDFSTMESIAGVGT